MKLAVTLSALILAVSSLDASAAAVRWQGEFMITASSGTCDYDPTGDFGRARFRPGIGGENGAMSQLTFFGSRNASSFRLDPGMFNTNFKTVQTMYVGDGFGPVDNVVKVRFATSEPSTIKTGTDFLAITGQIKGYDFMPLCTVDFKMSLVQRVE